MVDTVGNTVETLGEGVTGKPYPIYTWGRALKFARHRSGSRRRRWKHNTICRRSSRRRCRKVRKHVLGQEVE